MVLYMYALSFGVFMTETFRLPAPLLFGFPLLLLFRDKKIGFFYLKELLAFTIALFCFYIIGSEAVKSFAAIMINFIICLLYFNYFIGSNQSRYNFSILIFYLLLGISSVVMILNNFYPEIDRLRELIMDEQVLQSPSGIASNQFTFGYHLAAFASFILTYTFLFHKPLILKVLVFLCCLVLIYLGMQRSVFITFACSVTLFFLYYYRYKGVLLIVLAGFAGMLFYSFVLKNDTYSRDNILTKNMNNEAEHNRTLLTSENLKIYSEYPLGLVFYGKTWGDVIYRNKVFSTGITSHNAYLMFITYLGPFLGLGLLLIIYSGIMRIGYNALTEIRKKDNALLVCLCFSFLAVSINAFAHNAWLISADGPTLFLYFSILHFNKIQSLQA